MLRTRHVHGEMFQTSLGAMHIRIDGLADKPAVILIHGFAGSLHWFDRVVSCLEADHRVIRVDLFGHGCTGGDRHLEADTQAQGVREIIDALGLADVMMVGHSYGSDVVLKAAASPRISRVVLIDQAPDLELAHFPPGNNVMTVRGCAQLLRALAFPAIVRRIGQHAFADDFDSRSGFDNPRQLFDDFIAVSPDMYRVILVDRRRRLQHEPLDRLVYTLDKPTTVIHGREDKFYDWQPTLERYSAAGALTVLVEDAGHSPNIEQPEQLSAVLRAAALA